MQTQELLPSCVAPPAGSRAPKSADGREHKLLTRRLGLPPLQPPRPQQPPRGGVGGTEGAAAVREADLIHN